MWTFPLICPPQQSRCWWGMMTSVWAARLFVRPWLTDAWLCGGQEGQNVPLFGPSDRPKLEITNRCETFYCKYWCGFEKTDWAVHLIIIMFFFCLLLRRSENWERHRTKCSGGIWSITGTRGPRDGGVHHHFQKLKSTSLYSLYCLTSRTLWRQSVVWWITEKETEQTQLLHQSSRLFLSSFERNVNDWPFFFLHLVVFIPKHRNHYRGEAFRLMLFQLLNF